MTSSQERRVTKFPGSALSSLITKTLTGLDSTNASELNSSDLPKISEKQHTQLRSRPPALSIKVNTFQQANSFLETKNSETKKSKTIICRPDTPWKDYKSVLIENQVESIILAQKSTLSHTMIEIKIRQAEQKKCLKHLESFSHFNIVNLKEAFLADNEMYFVYEWMDVSLADIQCTLSGRLIFYQIATVCKEVYVQYLFIHIVDSRSIRSSKAWFTFIRFLKWLMMQSIPTTLWYREVASLN